jgi:hypothetical protein
VEVHFDLEHSGAMLTWLTLFPGEEPPALLRYIEDRDLWRNALPNGREVSAALFSHPYDFGIWDWLMEEPIGTFIRAGAAIERKHWKDLHELVARGRREMVIGGYRVPVVNLPYTMGDDAAGYLAEEAPFAASYWESERGREFSLRSKPGGVDVALVAEGYGGGGHQHAAGFLAPWGHPMAMS